MLVINGKPIVNFEIQFADNRDEFISDGKRQNVVYSSLLNIFIIIVLIPAFCLFLNLEKRQLFYHKKPASFALLAI